MRSRARSKGGFIGAAPVTLVNCTMGESGASAFVYAHEPVPAAADPDDVARLAREGFLAPARGQQGRTLTTASRGRS